MNDIIALDVGGTRFDTTRQTLLQDPNSMLAKMFDPNPPLTPGLVKNGAYFLDRDPEYFRFILNYLRNGVLLADTSKELHAVLCEARYFSLFGLEELVLRKLEPEPEQPAKPQNMLNQDIISLNVGGRIFQTTRNTLAKYSDSKLAHMLDDKTEKIYDSDGNLFLDEDPTDFEHILRAMRNSSSVPTAVTKDNIDNILNLRDNLEIREIKFGYREQSNSFVSEYFLSDSR